MPIKIDVAPLLQEVGRTSHIELEEKLSYPEDGLDIKGPTDINVELLNTGETLLLKAEVKANVKLECSRCLEKFIYPLEFKFEEEYAKEIPPPPKGKKVVELTNNDFLFKIEKDNTIDLSEAIRQNMLTQLPIKPLCSKCPDPST